MSHQKLTVIVTCTDRKSATPEHDLMARHLAPGPTEARARLWIDAVDRSPTTYPLVDLYCGETWVQVKRLARTAQDLGYEPEVLVASAGLGIRALDERAPAYAATFSTGHADSVARSKTDAQAWWQALPHTRVRRGGRAIWVLSEQYSRAVGLDLKQRLEPQELLVFGGSDDIPAEFRIAPNRSLRRALGGTLTSLNLRTATQWLHLSHGSDPFGELAKHRWSEWSGVVSHQEKYARTPLTDAAVVEFVRVLRAQEPDVSKTRALKTLRSAGCACEQQRFSTLFEQAVIQ